MARLIKKFADGSLLEYDQGRFDTWCIYHVQSAGYSSAIKDQDIFEELVQLSQALAFGTSQFETERLNLLSDSGPKF